MKTEALYGSKLYRALMFSVRGALLLRVRLEARVRAIFFVAYHVKVYILFWPYPTDNILDHLARTLFQRGSFGSSEFRGDQKGLQLVLRVRSLLCL